MRRKIVTFAITLAMLCTVFAFPVMGFAAEKQQSAAVTKTSQTAQKQTVPSVSRVSGVKAKAVSSTAIKLTWKKTKGAARYQVYQYSKNKKKYVKIKTVKTRTYTRKSLKADTAYRFKIRAYTKKGGKVYYGKISKAIKKRTQKSDGQKIVAKAKKKIGARYRAGGAGPNAFDCSGFVYWVYKTADVRTSKKVSRTSTAGLYNSLKKYKIGSSLPGIKKAKAGDIILFKRGGRFNHSAIYAGNGKIIHAATARKGVISQSVRQLHNSGTRVAAIIRVVK